MYFICVIKTNIERKQSPNYYRLPKEQAFERYIDGLSQSLAMTVATAHSDSSMLYGERLMLDYQLNLSLEAAESDICQLMFVSSLAKNKAYGSKIYLEYASKVKKLQRNHPLSGPAGVTVEKTIASLYSEN